MADGKLFPPLAALRAFEAVGRLGGIRKAARELGTDHAVVSRHIRALEAWVNTALLAREGGDYRLTETGRAYHGEIERALATIAGATGALTRQGERMRLSIWCIPGFAFLWLSDRLGSFLEANPDIDLDFRPADDLPDFRAKDVDGAIRYIRNWDEAGVPRHVHRLEFARPPVFPVAAPSFAAALPPLATAADLPGCTLLHEDSDEEWRHWLAAQGVSAPQPLPGPRLWHAHLTLNAARQGQGIALANPLLLRDDLETGRLVRIEARDRAFAPVQLGSYRLMARADQWNATGLARFRSWLTDRTGGCESIAA
jgi:LysR family transcriptional regulator, glycine cleavage system transcriptional activator